MIKHLVDAGCFDFTNWTRDQLRMSIDPFFESVSKNHKEKTQGIMNLFSLLDEKKEERFLVPPKISKETPKNQILFREKELLGFFLTGHPMEQFQTITQRLSCIPLSEIENMEVDTVFRASFIIEAIKVRVASTTQKKFAFLTVNDRFDSIELPIWSNLYEEKSHLLINNQLLCAVLQVEERDEVKRITCHWLENLENTDENMVRKCDEVYDRVKFSIKQGKGRRRKKMFSPKEKTVEDNKRREVHLRLKFDDIRLSDILSLKTIFNAHRGNNPVTITLEGSDVSVASIHIESKWGVSPDEAFKESFKDIPGFISIQTIPIAKK